MKKHFIKSIKASLILVYAVIIAGAVVRATGSGMGCPDWPKCFGYYIPPTQQSQLDWKADAFFKEGRIIIVDKSLKVAQKDFVSTKKFNPENWKPYTKHNYATFNPVHTWVEYINRLMGALSGIPILIMMILSFGLFKQKKRYLALSVLVVFCMGFQAWLGKTVVDSNLAPIKITIHMLMALFIVALLLYLLHISKEKKPIRYNSTFSWLLLTALILTLVQIVLGTQVRQFVDEQIKLVGYQQTELWLTNPKMDFYIHRSFSIVVLLFNGFLIFRERKLNIGLKGLNWVIFLIGIASISGVLMYYLDFPVGFQTIHLVVAALLFGVQFDVYLQSRKKTLTSTEV